jgi:hypothetical protein
VKVETELISRNLDFRLPPRNIPEERRSNFEEVKSPKAKFCKYDNEPVGSTKVGQFLDLLIKYQLLRQDGAVT